MADHPTSVPLLKKNLSLISQNFVNLFKMVALVAV